MSHASSSSPAGDPADRDATAGAVDPDTTAAIPRPGSRPGAIPGGTTPGVPSTSGPSTSGGRPAGTSTTGASPTGPSTSGPTTTGPSPTGPTTTGARASGATAAEGGTGGGQRSGATPAGGGGIRQRLRNRRRLVIAGVAVLGALLALLLCGGVAALVAGLDRDRDERHENRRLAGSDRTACLELERRLNRLAPPGAAPDAARRAAAIRDENAALRPYLADTSVPVPGRRGHEDRLAWWQQLLDARTTYAEALDRQAAARTPAFFQAPRTAQGIAVADRLLSAAPDGCAGSIRRLAAPDL